MSTVTPPADVVTVVGDAGPVVGMQLPIQSQSTLYTAAWETEAGPDELARVAVAAEAAGFFYVGVCDHTAIPARLAAAMSTTWYDTVATLAWLAAQTTTVRLLSHVLVLAERHPLRAAKELCTLDRLSGGRLIVGVGAGHVAEEYETLTGDFERRGAHTDEAVVALARAMTEEFPVLDGPRFPARDLGVAPRPVQTPRPPIWIGGSSGPALRRTAALGDGWLPQGTRRADLPGQIARLRQLRAELRGGAPLDLGTIAEPVFVTGVTGPPEPGWAASRHVLCGPPEELAPALAELVAMGVDHLQIRVLARSVEECCEQIGAVGSELLPRLAPRRGADGSAPGGDAT